jgi:hypothetical protein
MKTFQHIRRQQRARRLAVIRPNRIEVNRTSLREALDSPIQTKLRIGATDDHLEREADSVADRVLAMPEGPVQRKAAENELVEEDKQREQRPGKSDEEEEVQRKVASDPVAPTTANNPGHDSGPRSGHPLPASERAYFEPRLGADLGEVRVHADSEADRLAAGLSARAFTVGSNVYFGQGQYQPGSHAGRHLLGHELAHVLQQTGKETPSEVRCKLELRPPGKGEHSAFDRAQELIDRLNTISPAIQYTLTDRVISYTIKDETALTHFDRTMKEFIDRDALVPMRLITHRGLVDGQTLVADSFISAYVDLDDMMKDDLYSFQSDLMHFLTERFQVKNYDKKIGTDFSALFPKAHKAGKDAEAALLQDIFKDPSIHFLYEETKANGTWVNAFKSKDYGYRVFQVVKHTEKSIAGGEMWVQKKDGTRVSMDDFRKERAAATP